MNDDLVIKEGYLEKQSLHLKTFRKRWMVLKENKLYSYKEKQIYLNQTEIIDLKSCKNVTILNKNKNKFVLTLNNKKKRVFIAQSIDDMNEWIKCLKNCIDLIIDNDLNDEETKSDKHDFDRLKFEGKKVVIIGAGPAGIHMASLLIKIGYKSSQIILLEKENRCCGKSYSKPDIDNFDTKSGANNYGGYNLVHEMGTCYLHPEYHVISELIKEYDPTNVERPFCAGDVFGTSLNEEHEKKSKADADDDDDDEKNPSKVKFTEWALNQCSEHIKEKEHTVIPKKYIDKLPEVITGGSTFELAVNKYCKIHQEIFGKRKETKKKIRGFPGRPSPEQMKRLNCTFLDFLKENKLEALVPFLVYSQSMQGYGILDQIPAFYGMYWTTPELMKTTSNILRVAMDSSNVVVLSKGYEHLWQSIVNKFQLNIIYNVRIKSVDRDLQNQNKNKNKIKIKYKIDDKWFLKKYKTMMMEENDNKEEEEEDEDDEKEIMIEADLLFLACGCRKALEFLTDATDEEKEIFSCIKPDTLCATLFEYDINPTLPTHQSGGDLWPNIIWKASGEVYAYRNSLKAIIGSKKYDEWVKQSKLTKDRGITYQYLHKIPNEKEDAPKLREQLMRDLSIWGETNIKIIQQEVWDYFPKWNISEIVEKEYPWKVKNELQGKYNNCFYIGSSVCFESVLNVCEYNIELCNQYMFEEPDSTIFFGKKRLTTEHAPFGEYLPL